MGLFKKIAQALAKTRDAFRKKLDCLFSGGELNDEFYEELEDILVSSDVGVATSIEITEELQREVHKNKVRKAEDAKILLKKILVDLLNSVQPRENFDYPLIITVIGVNGVGKTTSIGKLANYFKNQKKEVTLVAGPVQLRTAHAGIRRMDVKSAKEMYDAVVGEMEHHDIVVSCAAVADFKPVHCEQRKVKRGKEHWTLELEPTADIAEELGKRKRSGQLLVGFALETNDELSNALQKLHKKNLDLIVLNSLRDAHACFGYDTNKVTLIDRDERQYCYELKTKREVAEDIVDRVVELMGK